MSILPLLLLLAQTPADVVLEAEHVRDAAPLLRALADPDVRIQQLAARGIGRVENPAHRDALAPLLSSPDPQVRRAAVAAFAQMRATFEYGGLQRKERDPAVRSVIYEAIGRAKPPTEDAEALLVGGLSDPEASARTGAARGLESLFRLNRPRQPNASTAVALHAAFAANSQEELRELILLTMNAAGDHDPDTLAKAAKDPSPQVRRLAVLGTRIWVGDPSPIVRYEALRAAKSCERATAAVNDPSDHVALEAVDLLGSLKCDAAVVAPLVNSPRSWRIRAHALVSLAAVDPAQARLTIPKLASVKTWQVRVYAAKAARIVGASDVLAKLARDAEPNVAIAAMTTTDDAAWALKSSHSGLLLAAAEKLKNAPDLKISLPAIVAAFNRLTAGGAMTVRDPRVALLTRIGEARGNETFLQRCLDDRDPAIAALAAQILTLRTGAKYSATSKLPIPPRPPAAYIAGLKGATARFTLRGLGTITVDLLTDEAPVTVGVFAQLVEAGKYNGLTFHRIVPNFVIQGGSPGADEYDGQSREFMRDEVGLARNVRGSIGISTRGRDTGDAQIYFNLVDNFRLDHDYTVMAAMREGIDVMDRVQEGDVIERIEIVRRGAHVQ